jgi:MFS family permease
VNVDTSKLPSHPKKAILIWLVATIFYFYEFFLQVSPGIMIPEIMQNFHVTAKDVGYLATWYFIAYASMQIPAGALFDRFSVKILLTVACSLCSLGTLLFAVTNHFFVLELSRFLTGIGSAFAFLGTLVIASSWFPPHRFALLSGSVVTIGMLGAIGGEKPLALLFEYFGWHTTLLLLFAIGVLLSVLLFCIIEDKEKRTKSDIHPFAGIAQIIRHKQSWLVAMFGALIYGTTATLGAIWGVSFLRIAYGLSNPEAAGYISMIFVGWALGSPFFGLISDALRRRKPTLYFSGLMSFILLSIIIYSSHLSHTLLVFLFIAFGFASSAFLPAFSIIKELHPKQFSGTALGLMNMFNSLGGALIPPIIGYSLEANNPLVTQIADYSVNDFHHAFLILPLGLLIAFFIVPFIKETHAK